MPMQYGERKRPEPCVDGHLRKAQVAYAPRTASAFERLRLRGTAEPTVEISPNSNLRQFPHLSPLNLLVISVYDLLDQQISEIFSLSPEHKLLRVRFGNIEEAEVRIHRDADSLKRHNRSHHIGEMGWNAKGVFIDHVRQFI